MRPRILYIQRHHKILSSTLRRLERIGYAAMGVQSIPAALDLMRLAPPDCVLLALDCPQVELQHFLAEYASMKPIPLLAMRNSQNSHSFMNERKFGAYFYGIIDPAIDSDKLKNLFAEFTSDNR